MIRFLFGPDDIARTRFALSPLFELQVSVAVLRDPERYPIHADWARRARRRAQGLALAALDALVPSGSGVYVPDFTAPPPAAPRPRLDDELARVAATPARQVADEIGWAYPDGPPAVLRPLLERPQTALAALVALMRRYWERVLAPDWPALEAVLEADLRARADALAAGGVEAAVTGLHRDVRFAGNAVELRHRHSTDVELAGRGLLLVPSAFAWPRAFALYDKPHQPSIIYAPAGVGDLWAPAPDAGQALADLLGRGRARVLTALATPATTTGLARRLGSSPAGVSKHLGILRRAGLVSATREGRAVRYARTRLGDELAK